MPVSLKCESAGCGEVKTGDDMSTCIALMQLHQKNVHDVNQSRQKPPKINRPTIQQSVREDEWAAFTRKWQMFKDGTDLVGGQVNAQLLACCEAELESALFREDPDISSRTEEEVLQAIERLTVVRAPLSVRRSALLQMAQDPGESVRHFVARLKGAANVCEWRKSNVCKASGCSSSVVCDYTEEIVKLVLLNGLSDNDIRKEILGTADIDNKSLNDTIALVDSRETARRAMEGLSAGVAASSYKKSTRRRFDPCPGSTPSEDTNEQPMMKCRCGRLTPKFGVVRGKHKQFDSCLECWKKSRTAGSRRTQSRNDHAEATFHHVASACSLDVLPHPTLRLNVAVDEESYKARNLRPPPMHPVEIDVVADSGAQTCLMGTPLLKTMGLEKRHLMKTKKCIIAANSKKINVIGEVFLRLSGHDKSGKEHYTSVVGYVTDSSDRFYLSQSAMAALGVIDDEFPQIGAANRQLTCHSIAEARGHLQAECGCPLRTEPPPLPERLPFTPSSASTEQMKQWILSRYASSTFNVCPHQPLPAMSGPPMEIRVDSSARPVVTKRPPNVPIHWQEDTLKQIERDVALGVIEPVPPNTPVTWLHNMVLTAKSDGTPRRTVDLQPLNKHCVRETHHTVPPVKQARVVPRGTIKTVLDAWNGFHSIEIRPEDRHLTTFLTEQGRYRYKRAPMGFLASQDAYTQRYDTIIADVVRKTKCVDDTLLWDGDIQTHWWRVLEYLSLVGRKGIVLNPSKFQFASTTVEFAGFEITDHEVKPMAKHLNAIAQFPTPKNITDIRAWFGLINQVSHYGRLTSTMAPFRPLLSSKAKFYWCEELDKAFRESKEHIIQKIHEGVEIFDPRRRTCLNPDFSKTGIGYWLRQKYCRCDSIKPGCCKDGWKITIAGSRFLRDAESRYAPVEGEALAVAWALEDSRFFTLGCNDLVITTDHKPLTKILGDQELADIANPRLFRIKQRTLPWKYRIVHVPGASIPAADSASRYPANAGYTCEEHETESEKAGHWHVMRIHETNDDMETSLIAASKSKARELEAVTWEKVREITSKDDALRLLSTLVEQGFPASRDNIPESLQPFWQFRNNLSIVDGVIMMDHRIVVPTALREEVLRVLHSAHQGTTKMLNRAAGVVFWPQLSKDIENTRAKCQDCWFMSPSQARMPPVTPVAPNSPFQSIAADYFEIQGTHYLVIVDRFSGWPHIIASSTGTKGFLKALLNYCSTFGVPQEITTDGGAEFTARETEDFLQRWGISHRVSSAYHAQANGRAEAAVKSMKRLMKSHTSAQGGVDTEAISAGLLQYRNTPDPETSMSPSQIVFGRNIRDLLPVSQGTQIFDNKLVHPIWRDNWLKHEEALRVRFAKQVDTLRQGTRLLHPLATGDKVLVQNQTGRHKRWDRSGTVVEVRPHGQYVIKIDGSGRVSLRNRQFLKKIVRHMTHKPAMIRDCFAPNQSAGESHEGRRPDLAHHSHPATDVNGSPPPAATTYDSESTSGEQCDDEPDIGDSAGDTSLQEANLPVASDAKDSAPSEESSGENRPISPKPYQTSPRTRPRRTRRPPARFSDYVVYSSTCTDEIIQEFTSSSHSVNWGDVG